MLKILQMFSVVPALIAWKCGFKKIYKVQKIIPVTVCTLVANMLPLRYGFHFFAEDAQKRRLKKSYIQS